MEIQKTSNSQSNLEKEEWNWRNQPAWLQALLQSHIHQDSMALAQTQEYRSMKQNRKPRDKSMHLWDQPWDFFRRNDAKAETLVLWPPHAKSWLIGKDSDAGQEEKGTTEDEMAGWHHWLDGRESEWTPGVGHGQGGLVCCDSWGWKESDMTEWLNWTELILEVRGHLY